MAVTIFRRENGSTEEWLEVLQDGSVVYHVENSGWVAARGDVDPRETKMTAAEAKVRWPAYAAEIEKAVTEAAPREVPKFNEGAVAHFLRNLPERSERE